MPAGRLIHGLQITPLIQSTPKPFQRIRQSPSVVQAIHRDVAGQLKQLGGVIAHKGVMLFPQPTAPGKVSAVPQIQMHAWRQPRLIGPVPLTDHGTDGRIQFPLPIGARCRRTVSRLHHLIGLMIASPGIHRTNQGEFIRELGVFRQMFADMNARQRGGNGGKRAAPIFRQMRLGIQSIDVAGAATHPK